MRAEKLRNQRSGPRIRKNLVENEVFLETGAGNEVRTRDLNLGKVALYQLSYSRLRVAYCRDRRWVNQAPGGYQLLKSSRITGQAALRYEIIDQMVSAEARNSST